jgi:hypothetical protein
MNYFVSDERSQVYAEVICVAEIPNHHHHQQQQQLQQQRQHTLRATPIPRASGQSPTEVFKSSNSVASGGYSDGGKSPDACHQVGDWDLCDSVTDLRSEWIYARCLTILNHHVHVVADESIVIE